MCVRHMNKRLLTYLLTYLLHLRHSHRFSQGTVPDIFKLEPPLLSSSSIGSPLILPSTVLPECYRQFLQTAMGLCFLQH